MIETCWSCITAKLGIAGMAVLGLFTLVIMILFVRSFWRRKR